ncbi:MAG TPA: SusC/RagA family TonB-linked outer membrane protein [Longimicrobiales bacterium]|nr:SusC/RagA family TonB-linked outer membrane protein [Longimicrobiales bacterium]
MSWNPRQSSAVLLGAMAGLLFLGTGPVRAQETGGVAGTVISETSMEPLPGVQVQVLGSSRGALTNADGRYVILGIPPGQRTLTTNMLGYGRAQATVTVVAGQTATVDFTLQFSAIEMDEMVVTGTPGAQTKRELGNTIGKINVDERIEMAPINHATELLTARTPGLTLMANSGQTGASSNIRIRGAGSLSGGYQPVFYVDGIRIESGNMEANSLYQGGTALDFLNPDDIESIEVIKGPAAATLYGADAANGVIQVITKKGRQGADAAQWSASVGIGEVEWLRSTSGDNYTTYSRCTVARQNSNTFPGCQVVAGNRDPADLEWWGKDSDGNAQLFTGIPEADIIRIPDSEEFILRDDPLFRHPAALRTGSSMDINTSVRGGSERMGYFLSFNKNDEEGVYFNNFANRIGGRGNFDVQAAENLNISSQFSYTRTHLQQPLSNNASNGLIRNAMRGRARAQSAPWEPGFLGFSPWVTNEFDNQNRIERMTVGITGNWQPFDWFRNKLTLGLDRQTYLETGFTRQDTTGRAPWGQISATGVIDHEIGGVHRWTVDYAGTASAQLTDELHSAFSGGMQLNARKRRDFFASGQGLVANNLNLVGAAATRNASESVSEQTSLGFFFEERLGWRDRLYGTAAIRVDDNSAFGSDFSLVVYPKASLAWIISDEEFFDFGLADEVKLRLAWGRAGNAPSPFSADRTFTSGQGVRDDALVNTLTISEYGNPNLKAETGQELEAGFDASLLEGRLGVEFTFYNQKTVDALISVPDPRSTGFTGSHLVNIGEIANRGIELLLTGSPLLRRNFNWDATLAFSTNGTELVSFNGAREEQAFGSFASVQRHREGYPLGGFWAVDVERDASGQPVVRDDDGNIIANPVLDASGQNVTVLNSCRWAPSDPTWDQAAECEEMFMGPSRPTREAAFTNTFTLFSDFRIFTHFQYAGGHYQWCAACSLGTRIDVNTWDVTTGGTPLNPDVTVADVLALRSLQTRSHISRADYIKFRELSLTYAVPQRWTSYIAPGSRWAATVSGRNLTMWTKYEGKGDPEVQFNPNSTFTMLDYASTPQTRRLSASLRVTF